MLYNLNMTVEQLEITLINLPVSERLRLAHLLLSSILESKPKSNTLASEFEYTIDIDAWLTLSEPSFDFWDNAEDAYYDNL